MAEGNGLSLAYYGDDFTGATDALESLSRAGLRTVLFLDDPTPERTARFGDLDAVGVAGMTRSMAPAEMERRLATSFAFLKALHPKHVHYKVCSTFDSSPETGSIGKAIETGARVFQNAFIPVLAAAPHLGRYSAFGNLYARMGIGSQGAIYRLDRHPSMRTHPITPAMESDLRQHLAQQTRLPMGLVDLLDLSRSVPEIKVRLEAEIGAGKRIIFFDALYDYQMATIGEILDCKAAESGPLFSVGSSGIEKALGDFWAKGGLFHPRQQWEPLSECSPMLVLSGSVSPVTAAQIEWAVQRGFEEVPVGAGIVSDDASDCLISAYEEKLVKSLRSGKSAILHTAKGPDDPRIPEIRSSLDQKGWDERTRRIRTAMILGRALGQAARRALTQCPAGRLVIAGGDTASWAARELGIEAVEMMAPLFPGAPLCRAYASGSPVDGIEINLKGGQVGDETYFGALLKGRITG